MNDWRDLNRRGYEIPEEILNLHPETYLKLQPELEDLHWLRWRGVGDIEDSIWLTETIFLVNFKHPLLTKSTNVG